MSEHPDQFVISSTLYENHNHPVLAVSGFFDKVAAASAVGDFTGPRDRVLLFSGVIPGEVTINMTRLPSVNVDDWGDWSRAEIQGRQQVLETFEFLKKYIPGFAHAASFN